MRNRITMAAGCAGAVSALLLDGCGSPSGGRLASAATVTINGNEARPDLVRCYQQEWYRTIALGDDVSGATVVIDQRQHPATATSVRFHNFGGFTGTYSAGGADAADTRFDGGNFVITGTANGATTAKPTEAVSADFTITVKC